MEIQDIKAKLIAIKAETFQEIKGSEYVKISNQGNITEIMHDNHPNRSIAIKKINNDEYIELGTGEIKTFNHYESRKDDYNQIRATLTHLLKLINTNVPDISHTKWVTLTYRQRNNPEEESKPMTDTKKLKEDFKIFNKELRRKGYEYEYIVAMEPQQSGSWHAHMIMIFPTKAPYISNELISDLWKQGFTKTQSLKGNNPGAYFKAYLTDIDINEVDELYNKGEINKAQYEHLKKCKTKKSEDKKYIKGARLMYYPPKFNLYRCSKGIKEPREEFKQYNEIDKKKLGTLTFQKQIDLIDTNNNNEIKKSLRYQYFNKQKKWSDV